MIDTSKKNETEYETLEEMAQDLCGKIMGGDDPFVSPVLVFHNTKAEQWFRAYYLKKNDGVLMNVRMTTLPLLIGDIINPDGKYTLMDRSYLEIYILKVLLDPKGCDFDPAADRFPYEYIYGNNCVVKNGIHLHELAGKLAALFLSYELSEEEIENMEWETKLYHAALNEAKKDDCRTMTGLYQDGNLRWPEEPVYIMDNSYISALFRTILDACPNDNIHICTLSAKEKENENKKPGKIISAPSMLREVEAVHSEICKLASGFKKGDLYSNILVYAPSIGDYANTINRVFQQDDPKYPSVPYCIVGQSACRQDLEDSLSTLFDIANKRFFTRKDFSCFVRNPSIRLGKKLTEKEIDVWMTAIEETNTRRNGKNTDDWKYLKTRMLLSLVVGDTTDEENCTVLGGTSWLPYASMSLEPESISRMIDMIDLLSEWVSLFPRDLKDMLCGEKEQQKIMDCLDRMYSRLNTDGDERNYLYNEVKITAERMLNLKIQIPADTLLLLLKEAPVRYTANPSEMFTGGVTFISFNTDDIYSEKHIFVMGMSSADFPGKDIRSELDRSEKAMSVRELDDLSMKHLLRNAGSVTFSYVNCDLEKDEKFFPSASVTALYPDYEAELVKIPLDESRDYGELFTKKEFREKKYFSGIGDKTAEPEENAGQTEKVTGNMPVQSDGSMPVITVSDIKKYLENTAVYKMKKLFGSEEDDSALLDEYEHIDLEKLEKYNLIRSMVLSESMSSKVQMDMEKKLPEGDIGDAYHTYLNDGPVSKLREEIQNGDYTLFKIDPLKIKNGSFEWLLKNSTDVFRSEKPESRDLYYLEPIDYWSETPKTKKYFNMYALSLMDAAGRGGEETYTVHLGSADDQKTFSVTPSEARVILNKIFDQMNDFTDVRYMDIDYVDTVINKKKFDVLPSTVKKFAEELNREHGHSSWQYYPDRKLVNPYDDFGYTDGSIKDQMKEMCGKIGDLILFDNIAKEMGEVQ